MRTSFRPTRLFPARLGLPHAVSLLVLAALVLVAPARAAAQLEAGMLEERGAEWVQIERVEHGTVFLDTLAIAEVGDDIFQVRTRWRFARPQRDGDGERYRSSVAVRAVDCRTGEMALLAYADRDGRRTVDTAVQPLYAARWERAAPASVAERIAASTCSFAHRSGRVAVTLGGEGAVRAGQ